MSYVHPQGRTAREARRMGHDVPKHVPDDATFDYSGSTHVGRDGYLAVTYRAPGWVWPGGYARP